MDIIRAKYSRHAALWSKLPPLRDPYLQWPFLGVCPAHGADDPYPILRPGAAWLELASRKECTVPVLSKPLNFILFKSSSLTSLACLHGLSSSSHR